MKKVVRNERDLAQVLTQVSMLAPDLKEKAYDIEIKPHRERRTLDANSYFHSLVHQLAAEMHIGNEECKIKMNLEYGTPMRIDENTLFAFVVPHGVDATQKIKYAKYMKQTDKGDVYIVYKETHTLDSKEFWRLLKGVEYECQQFGIETLDDREKKRLIEDYEKHNK